VEAKSFQALARVANGDYLGMRGWVIAGGHLIAAASDDFVSLDDNRAEWSSVASTHHLDREANRFAHKFPVHSAILNTPKMADAKGNRRCSRA
jgi:hypothetical protein